MRRRRTRVELDRRWQLLGGKLVHVESGGPVVLGVLDLDDAIERDVRLGMCSLGHTISGDADLRLVSHPNHQHDRPPLVMCARCADVLAAEHRALGSPIRTRRRIRVAPNRP